MLNVRRARRRGREERDKCKILFRYVELYDTRQKNVGEAYIRLHSTLYGQLPETACRAFELSGGSAHGVLAKRKPILYSPISHRKNPPSSAGKLWSGSAMPVDIQPPGPITGFEHPRCFASADGNCSRQLSREHYISASLLRQIELDGTTKIAGLSWQNPEAFNIISTKTLVSKVLCSRHNSSLSPLDEVMGDFSTAIRKFDKALHKSADSVANEEQEYSGHDIERWMLKCLIGMTISGNLKDRKLKPECVGLLYDRINWPPGWGLYWNQQSGSTTYHSDSLAIQTHKNPANDLILAATFTLRGLPLCLCLGRPDHPQHFGIYRPAGFLFRTPQKERKLTLNWEGDASAQIVLLDRVGIYDGPPPDWREWERRD